MTRSVFWAQLCLTLRAQLSSEDAPPDTRSVERLDDDGYLQCTLEEVAWLFRVLGGGIGHVHEHVKRVDVLTGLSFHGQCLRVYGSLRILGNGAKPSSPM